jgi:hypothetical protein
VIEAANAAQIRRRTEKIDDIVADILWLA